MKRFLKWFAIICLFPGFLAGCVKETAGKTLPHGSVTQVDIYYRRPACTVTRHYTSPEKVEAVLIYLRLLQPIGPVPLTPQAQHAGGYEIVVHLQNGGKRIHRQCSDCFASIDDIYWGAINPRVGRQLPLLMDRLPSDPAREVSQS